MNNIIYKTICENRESGVYPFHMPGHKGNVAFLPPDLLSLDVTEIPGMDVLSFPRGPLKVLEESVAEFYSSDKSFLLVNGSSAGIVAAICSLCDEGRKLFAPRNAHTSMYNGLVHSGAEPVYYLPEMTDDGLCGGVMPETFMNMPQGACAFVVSPTYEGFVSDIEGIARVVHRRGGVLIVDEAHGAHFAFSADFPVSAIKLGADIAVNSFHKTLPMLSQTAVLHANRLHVDLQKIGFYVNSVQTTSPSYIMMAACDFTLGKLWSEPWHFISYVHRLKRLRNELRTGTALSLSGAERIGRSGVFDIDIGKLHFSIHAADLSGEAVERRMASELGVQLEMASARHLLAMTSVADTDEGFGKLKSAVEVLNEEYEGTVSDDCFANVRAIANELFLPEVVLTPREAVRRKAETVPAKEAVSRISAELVAEYPPGITKIAPGERVPDGVELSKEFLRVLL